MKKQQKIRNQTTIEWTRSADSNQNLLLYRGSMTVEAAYIATLVTMVVFLVVVLTCFVYVRAWHTLAACETAATFECTGRNTSGADWEVEKMQKLMQNGPGFAIPAAGSVSRNGGVLSIEVSGHAVFPWLIAGMDYSRQIQVRQHEPVCKLRRIRAVKQMILLKE